MKTLKHFLVDHICKHPKTSVTGIAMISSGVGMIIADWKSLIGGVPEVAILGGVGLLLSADAKSSETVDSVLTSPK